ncbi:multidrug effflux MFS transporter [Thiomicrorhabdus hydrogeniphila]
MNRALLITFTALAGMIAPFSTDTYLPSFPEIESYYGVSRELLSSSMGVYLAAFAITTLVWGPFADRFGRKSVAIISLFGFGIASMGCALAPTFDGFMMFRVMQGVLAGGVIIGSRAMIRDVFSPKEAQKTMAVVMMLFAIAPALAPIVGGYLETHFDWQSIFWFLTLYAFITLIVVLFFIKETQHKDTVQSIQPKQLMASYLHTIKHPIFLRLVLSQSLIFGGIFVYIAGSASLLFDHLNLGPEDFWIQFVPMVGGMILGSMTAHRMTDKYSPLHMITASFTITGLAAMAGLISDFLFEPSVMSVIPFISVFAFGLSFGLPILVTFALDCLPEKRGMATSVQSFMQMGAAALVAIVIVPLTHDSLKLMALSMLLMWFVGVLLWINVYAKVQELEESR